MKKTIMMVAGAAGLLVLSANAIAAEQQLFTVPFTISTYESFGPTATFTLSRPAILDSYALTCSGSGQPEVTLTLDGGPLGLNGTTLAPVTTEGGTVQLNPYFTLEVPFVANGSTYTVQPTHLGIPISSSFSFMLNPTNFTGVFCSGYTVFRTI